VTGLSAVEQDLVDAVWRGETLDRAGREAEVRAEVIRDVLLGRTPTDPDPRGLRVRGVTVRGRLDLDGLRSEVRVQLRECAFPDGIWLRGATLPVLDLGGSSTTALVADELVVAGSVLLWRGFAATGPVSLVGARIGGKLDLTRARLDGGDGPALVADRMTVGSDVVLDDVTARGLGRAGTLQLTGARVGGRLSARRLRSVNRGAGPALSAANLQVADLIDLSKGADLAGSGSTGAVRLVGARFGSLSLGGARLHNPDGWALAAHYLDAGGTVYLDHLTAVGGLRLSGSRIAGQVDLTGSTVDGGPQPALAGTRLQVAQGVRLDGARLTASGERPAVDLRSARIAGDLELRRTHLEHPTDTALRLNTATVEGRVILADAAIAAGGLDLRDSTVGGLYDDPVRAAGFVEVNGLTYRGLPGRPGVTVDQRQEWLGRMPDYAAQPYRQLAAAYQGAGHEDDARRVLVAQQRRLTGALAGWTRLRHRLFGVTLQYGYQPVRAVLLLGVVLAAAIGLFLGFAGGTRTEAGPACPWVDRVGLAIDAAVPLVSTGAGDRCAPATATASGQALAVAGWGLGALGWASATLVVAGYSGLVRRR
jgi:hypothetical protein